MRLLYDQRSVPFEIQQILRAGGGLRHAADTRSMRWHARPRRLARSRKRLPCGTRRPGCPSRCVPCGDPLPPACRAHGQNAESLTLTRPCSVCECWRARATWALCRTRAERKGVGWVTHLSLTPFSASNSSSPAPTPCIFPVSTGTIAQSLIFDQISGNANV